MTRYKQTLMRQSIIWTFACLAFSFFSQEILHEPPFITICWLVLKTHLKTHEIPLRRRVLTNLSFTLCSAALTSQTASLACSFSCWQGWRAFYIFISPCSHLILFHFLSPLFLFFRFTLHNCIPPVIQLLFFFQLVCRLCVLQLSTPPLIFALTPFCALFFTVFGVLSTLFTALMSSFN